MTTSSPSPDMWTSHSIMSTPSSIAERNDERVFSGRSAGLPRWPPTRGEPLRLRGERGQAKSRIMRSLVVLLDEEVPVLAGCEINDHPYAPICRQCRDLIAKCGDEAPVEWLPRERRYGEKLATPDISIADLI